MSTDNTPEASEGKCGHSAPRGACKASICDCFEFPWVKPAPSEHPLAEHPATPAEDLSPLRPTDPTDLRVPSFERVSHIDFDTPAEPDAGDADGRAMFAEETVHKIVMDSLVGPALNMATGAAWRRAFEDIDNANAGKTITRPKQEA